MLLMPVVAALGCGVGVVLGGRPSNLSHLRLRGWPLLVVAVAAQVSLGWAPAALRWQLVILCAAAATGWCLVNRRQRGLRFGLVVLVAGILLNAAAIGANRGMPVSPSAMTAAGFPRGIDVSHGHFYKHVLMTDQTRLRLLADDIPLPFPVARTVLSAGDVLMLLGIIVCSATGSLKQPDLVPAPI